jgi:hypothetical protein
MRAHEEKLDEISVRPKHWSQNPLNPLHRRPGFIEFKFQVCSGSEKKLQYMNANIV